MASQKILITGGRGQLGQELSRLAASFPDFSFTFTDVDTLDITNPGQLAGYCQSMSPDYLINTAAYTQVDKAETESEKASLVNSTAIENIITALKGSTCRLIHLSTDFIYSGEVPHPCHEQDAPGPCSVYGQTKLSGERAARAHPATIILRTAWLYSCFGKNFVKTILRHASLKQSLHVVYDQTGTPTWARDLAKAIMTVVQVLAGDTPPVYGTYNYSNEGVCSWYDFAVEIVRAAGLNCRVLPVQTAEYPLPAPRPWYTVLDKTRFKKTFGVTLPHWRQSLSACLHEMLPYEIA